LPFFAAELEKWLHKHVPEILDLFLTPFLVVLLSTFVAIGVCQPVGSFLSEVIGAAATTAVNKGGALTGFIMGGCWLPLVMLGIHQGMTPIHAELLNHFGIDILLPIQAMAGCGQVGAALAVYCKTKNAALKKTVAVALPIGIMGVGEPLIYGVTFPLGKPFIGACIGGACGGVVQAIFVVGAFTMGISGLPLVASTDKMLVYLAGLGRSLCGRLSSPPGCWGLTIRKRCDTMRTGISLYCGLNRSASQNLALLQTAAALGMQPCLYVPANSGDGYHRLPAGADGTFTAPPVKLQLDVCADVSPAVQKILWRCRH
jgi:hypothetical protein